jgi:hypothetical protein
MLRFRKTAVGLNWDFWVTVVGSAIPRALPASMMALCLHVLLYNLMSDSQISALSIDHPYSVGALVVLVSFLIVYRAQQAYLRFISAAEWVFHMDSKLLDVVSKLMSFHCSSSVPCSYSDTFIDELFHLSSLLYAVNCLELRQDKNHGGLVQYQASKTTSVQSSSFHRVLPSSTYIHTHTHTYIHTHTHTHVRAP